MRIALKKFTQVLSYVVCTQVKRHVHKRTTKRRYGEKKSGRFVFGKPVLFTLGLGLSTPFFLGERKVRLCVKLFDFFVCEYSSVWPEFCRDSSQIQWRKLFWENFSEIFMQTKPILTKLVKFHPAFFNFYSASVLVHSRSGTYYALLLGYFSLKFLPDVRHCVCWILVEICASDSSHQIGNKFFNHHC